MPRPLKTLSAEKKRILYRGAVKEQFQSEHKRYEQSFREVVAKMPAKKQRDPRVRDRIDEGKQSLGTLPRHRVPELRYLIDAIIEVDDMESGYLYAICRHCADELLPRLITKTPMTARTLLDRVRQTRKARKT